MLVGEMLAGHLRGRLTAQTAAGCLHSKSVAAPWEAARDAEIPS